MHMTPPITPAGLSSKCPSWRDLLLALAVAFFTFASAWTSLQETPFGIPPDERAHATYVNEVARDDRFVPDYENSRILPSKIRENYLGHPPLYYTVLGLAGRTFDWNTVDAYRGYRMLSATMVALGMFFWMLVGRGLSVPPTWLMAAAAATNAVPMFPFLAGSINNDNMAYLGVAMAFFGLVWLRRWLALGLLFGALGVLVTFLSKATAALFLMAFFVLWAWPQWRNPASIVRSRAFLVSMSAAAAAAALYFVPTILIHGSPFPRPAPLYPADPPADPLGLGSFAIEFIEQMTGRLAEITSHASLSPIHGALTWVFWAMLLSPLFAFVLAGRRPIEGPANEEVRIAKSFMGAIAIAVAAHILFVWRTHLSAGVLAGMQPRYYNYALPGLFVFGFLHCWNSRQGRLFFGVFALCAALLIGAAPSLATRAQIRAQAAAATTNIVKLPPGSPNHLNAKLVLSTAEGGYVDDMSIKGDTVRGAGWAIDRPTRAAARGVTILLGDRVIARIGTGTPRPDVSAVLRSSKAATAGFRFRVDGLPAGTRLCDLRLAAEQNDGSLAFLTHRACRHRETPPQAKKPEPSQ